MKTDTRLAVQQGAALLLAMMTVVLVATLASAMLWQQWRTTSVETAERQSQQAHWLLVGAHDWSRVVMREDSLGSNTDHLGEPWAVPLRDARLSSFLAATPAAVAQNSDSLLEQVFLAGDIQDQQARLNVRNLVANGLLVDSEMQAWRRLYQQLDLPVAALQVWTDAYRRALSAPLQEDAPLLPQRVSQLTWLGMPLAHLSKLTPFITLLPTASPVNINTASAEVLSAVVPTLALPSARQWVEERQRQPWRSVEEAKQRMGAAAVVLQPDRHSVQSAYFEVNGRLRFNDIGLRETALIRRQGLQTHTVWQERRPWWSRRSCMSAESSPC
jgi:general secretion pathway protein K